MTTYGDFNLGGFITSSGSGTVNQTGGTVDAKGNLRLGIGSGTTGIYNLQDGVLYAKTITSGAGTAIFNFTGGTLHADNVQFALTNQGGTLAPGQSAGTCGPSALFRRAAHHEFAGRDVDEFQSHVTTQVDLLRCAFCRLLAVRHVSGNTATHRHQQQ